MPEKGAIFLGTKKEKDMEEKEQDMFLDDTPYAKLWEDYEAKRLPSSLMNLCFCFSEVTSEGFLSFFRKLSKKGALEKTLEELKGLLPDDLWKTIEEASIKWSDLKIDVKTITKKELKDLEAKNVFEKEETIFSDAELDFISLLNKEAMKRYKALRTNA